MKLNFRIFLATAVVAVLALSSCKAPKEVRYLQDFPAGSVDPALSNPGLLIQPGDMLNIVITTKDPELGTLFNLQPGTVVSDLQNTNNNNYNNSGRSNTGNFGYRVDKEGDIVFPMLGTIHVAGLTRSELETLLKNRILKEGLLKEFTVTVNFTNAQITILGDIGGPGNYPFKDDKYTIIQALADAGDLNISAERCITVIRERDGQRKVYEVDLKSRDLFNSPVYYLQQNDVIYVTPNKQKQATADSNASAFRQYSTWLGLASFVSSMTAFVIALVR